MNHAELSGQSGGGKAHGGEVVVRPVRTRRERRRFLTFPWEIYRNDPLWIPPLIPERMKVTNPNKGVFFERGTAAFFSAYRDTRMVGTICAACDPAAIEQTGRKDCMFGFFETTDDAVVAAALFAAAERWARDHGLTALVGPYNLDYEDGYGILTDGRDRPPVILCGHTPEYYQRIVEEAGFVPARAGNIALAVDLTRPDPRVERIFRAAEIAQKRARFVVRGARLQQWEDEAMRVHHLLNHSLDRSEEGGVPWPEEAVRDLVRPFLKIADPDLVLFADVAAGPLAGRTVGWFAAVPNMNEILTSANGLRYPWDYLSLLVALRRHPKCLAAKSLLVLPEYHMSGVAALLFGEFYRRAREKGYAWIDLSLTSEKNPETPVIAERAGAVRYKRYQVYRREILSA